MAWPVIEVEHHLKVRLEEELGVVERHLLEALARFGPLTSKELSSLLGLEIFVVDAVINELQRFPHVITRQAEKHAVPGDTLGRLSGGKWTREVEQPYAFLINGPTAELVPLELGKAPHWHWLEVSLADAGGTVKDCAGEVHKNVCWVAPLHSNGRASLVRALADSNPVHKADLGVPEGALEVMEGSGKYQRTRWLLALAEMRDDGSITVRPACRSDLPLLSANTSHAENFVRQIRRGKHSADWLLQKDAGSRAVRDFPQAWSDHLNYEDKNGTLFIALRHPANIPFWSGAADAEDGDADWQEDEDEARVPATEFPPRLRQVLSFSHWWHPFSFAVRRIEPQDDKSAEWLLLLAGLQRLTRLTSDGVDETFDLSAWWSETQNSISAAWKSDSGKVRVRFDVMLAAARRSPDGDVVNFISEFS